MDAGNADVRDAPDIHPQRLRRKRSFLGDGEICRARGDDGHVALRAIPRGPFGHDEPRSIVVLGIRSDLLHGGKLCRRRSGHEYGPRGPGDEGGHGSPDLVWGLAGTVDRLSLSRTEFAMVIELGVAEVLVREKFELAGSLVDAHGSSCDARDEVDEGAFVQSRTHSMYTAALAEGQVDAPIRDLEAQVTLPVRTLTVLVFVSLGFNVLVLFVVAAMASRRRTIRHGASTAHLDETLRGMLEGHARTFERLETAIRHLAGQNARIEQRLSGTVQRVGLIRYDAFEDVGGRLSFSCALLNEAGDGVVVTSINGRQDTRVYAKSVQAGESAYNLTEEEGAAIREALAVTEQKVEARR
jgi:hypothetical protein